jgi:hypothetical protein
VGEGVRSCPRAGCRRSACPVVCPAKAGMFSRGQTCRGRSPEPRSLEADDCTAAAAGSSSAFRRSAGLHLSGTSQDHCRSDQGSPEACTAAIRALANSCHGGRVPAQPSHYPESGSTHAARQYRFRRSSRPIEPGHHCDGTRDARICSQGPDLRGAIRGRLPAPPAEPMASRPRQPQSVSWLPCSKTPPRLSSLVRVSHPIPAK